MLQQYFNIALTLPSLTRQTLLIQTQLNIFKSRKQNKLSIPPALHLGQKLNFLNNAV